MPSRLTSSLVALLMAGAAPIALSVDPPSVAAQEDGCRAVLGTLAPADSEPNDTPDQALDVTGPLCLEGELPDGDQDLVAWTVQGSGSTWSVRITGVPGTLTIVQLIPITSEPGVVPVTTSTRLVELSSPVEATGEVTHPDLMLVPGRYVVAVGRSGRPDGGAPTTLGYRVAIVPGDPLPPTADIEPNQDVERASPITGAFTVSGDLSGDLDTFAWSVGAVDAGHAWTLRVAGELGVPLDLALLGPDRSTIALAFGTGGSLELVDLALAEGTWYVRLGQATDGPRPYRLEAVATAEPDVDREPNDDRATAQPLDATTPVASGRLARDGDRDHYRLTVDETMAARLLDIRLLARVPARRQLCLSDAAGRPLQCRDGTGPLVLGNLALPVGAYDIEVSGDVLPAARYVLRVDSTTEPAPDFEREPNDTAADATLLDPSLVLRGTTSPGDDDLYRVATRDAPGIWDVRVTGVGLGDVALVRPDGALLAHGELSGDGTTATLPDLYLEPGSHWVRVGGTGGDYTVELVPLGAPDIDAEREPNDLDVIAEPIRVGRPRTGRIRTAHDRDMLRFSTAAEEHLVLRVDPPADGAVSLALTTHGTTLVERAPSGPGEPLSVDVQLPAGEYELTLGAGIPSLDPYRVLIERADPFVSAIDQEPNGSPSMARPVPDSMRVEGIGDGPGDTDWYRLEVSADASALVLRTEGEFELISITDGDGSRTPQPARDDPPEVRRAHLTPGIPAYLGIRARGPYRVAIATGDDDAGPLPPPGLPPAVPDAPSRPTLAIDLALAADVVAAWWPEGQVVDGVLRIDNTSDAPMSLGLDARSSHHAWTLEPAQRTLELAALSSTQVPVILRIAPDAWADVPVRLTVRARDAAGSQVTDFVELVPARDAAPVGATRVWPVPDALLGGADVASLALGGEVVRARDAKAEAALHDGVSPSGGGFATYVELPQELTVDLAGDEPVLVAGTILDPEAGGGHLDDRLRAFDLLLSEDGNTFEVALSGELSPLPVEQSFVLPEPVPARFARLRMRTTWGVPADRVELGEWKVVAAAGATVGAGATNIADPSRGGHVVLVEPGPIDPDDAQRALDDDTTRQSMPAGAGPIRLTIGFRDGRAALVTEVRWVDPVGTRVDDQATEALVEAGTRGPTGPWMPIGTLVRGADGRMPPLALASPTWARYLRVTLRGHADDAERELPAGIQVLEAPVGDGYRSILGEWGAANVAGPMEWLDPPSAPQVAAPDVDPLGDQAVALPSGVSTPGVVTRDTDVDRYRIVVPEGQNRLELGLRGEPFVAARVTLFDDTGYEVPTEFGSGSEPGSVAYSAEVTPGATYDVVVDQPPASVVFAFDTSPSIDPWLASVLEALRAFAADVTPGQEAVQVQPFDARPMLPDWTDEPFRVRDAIGGYVKDSRSSDAEAALIDALDLLATRQGARAILLVTDAETSAHDRTTDLWAGLGTIRPLVFPVHIGGSETPVRARQLMQDWAAVAGGSYRYARTTGEMGRAFDRLATWLRRPASYELSWEASFVEPVPPTPGTIAVMGPRTSIGATTPMAIVLDTSGSMRRRVGGARRIDIAKKALRDLVEERIPAGTPVALRVFDAAADDCGTTLAAPLSPLDPEAMGDAIARLSVSKRTQTPIGAALEAVAQDLAGVEGPKSVVLVTDGKETCGGDPRAAIRTLVRETGAQVNIVGFALSGRAVKREMRAWAREGRGLYYDAPDARRLVRAVARAMGAPYRVYDATGAQVAGGTVNGAPVSLPPGTYAVEVLVDPVVRFTSVVVGEDSEVTLTLP